MTAEYGDLSNAAVRVPTASSEALVFRTPDGAPLVDRYGTDPGRLLVTDQRHGDMLAAIGNTSGNLLASADYAPLQ
ncbi:hypothetical protein [Micromonospora sp. DT229]|uniref:hypothetical protein n=1 Tax=Micromonospora sp. DT229 TaxID=3393430 RepID=UPI003CF37D82